MRTYSNFPSVYSSYFNNIFITILFSIFKFQKQRHKKPFIKIKNAFFFPTYRLTLPWDISYISDVFVKNLFHRGVGSWGCNDLLNLLKRKM